MEANTRNRTIALAALFQCVEGVTQIASRGSVDSELFDACINSVLTEDASSPEALYGGVEKLRTGLRVLMHQLGTGSMTPDGRPKDIEATRYAVNLLYLEKKLANDPNMFQALLKNIENAQQQLDFFGMTHPNMIARLAEIYSNTVSKIGPRIMIKGDQNHLSNPENAARIRALLLAGVRAALLWRQAGGSRWKLIFSRGVMQKEAQGLLRA
ncbi:MAG TPA: high frequency lysogenization protein HflD [Candidatus Thiothrix moscowensis]|uniref:high frequency lysogenization protein HflD n=1 Tax=unclassified Thiothrix TaxID=2636184 RepID=UPI0025F87EBC|nr:MULTISPECIES: high frequency lysogenization protein HflD [unclassified Thiothrix]HRJ53560.1 high frequency lysogenization protein HflD [Candidatus Thiothrix moscowensis]HRJ93632.1 high frequency lysogenization protein HflD [Candidatus Thiothrix moscowensis]